MLANSQVSFDIFSFPFSFFFLFIFYFFFEGEIPSELGMLKNLTELYVSIPSLFLFKIFLDYPFQK